MNRQNKTTADGLTPNQLRLLHMLRRLWVEHTLWTRAYCVSTLNGLPDLSAVSVRLLRNPKDFSSLFAALYGEPAAYRLETLLTDHLLIAMQAIVTAERGDGAEVARLQRRWYDNAGELAEYLGGINPHWDAAAWRTLLEEHLELTGDQFAHMLAGRPQEGIAHFEAAMDTACRMGDEMAAGICKQFKL